MARFHGLNTMRRNIRSTESPDCRDGIIDGRGLWYTRPGIIRHYNSALGRVNNVCFLKSDDCRTGHNFAMLASGAIDSIHEDYLPQPDHVVALWKFEEASGTIYDETANNNDGTYNGALYRQAGKVGYGLGFTTNDYVNVGTGSSLTLVDFTISFWFKTSDVSTYPTIIGRYQDSDYKQHWDVGIDTSGRFGASLGDGDEFWPHNLIQTTATYDDDEWHLGTVIKDGNTWDIYMDDAVITAYNQKDDITGIGDFNPSLAVQIGGDGLIEDRYYFEGGLDEVVIWNKALTATERLDYYNITN